MPRALITGICGQDGSYLAEQLVSLGYEVVGLVRSIERSVQRASPGVSLIQGDLRTAGDIRRAVVESEPDEIYNLGGITTLAEADGSPELAHVVSGAAPATFLQVIAETGRPTRFLQASSSQIFGPPDGVSRNESTPLSPSNAYARAKAFADQQVRMYRGQHGVFACSAILFNHESPRRPVDFVSRAVSLGVARIAAGLQPKLEVRSLSPARDWGFAGDYVRAMTLMLRQPEPRDFVIASGSCRTVADMVEVAFRAIGISDWRPLVVESGEPEEAPCSPGDPSRASKDLGWSPRVSFEELITTMVESDQADMDRSR